MSRGFVAAVRASATRWAVSLGMRRSASSSGRRVRRRRPPMAARAYFHLVLCVLALAPGSGCREKEQEDATAGAASAVEAPPLTTSWQKPRDTLLPVGDEAPDFVALAHTGHQVKLSSLSFRPTVVYFYPSDASESGRAEALALRDAWLELRERVSMVLGVSTDDNVTHRAFATEHDLPFLLISDVDRAITRSFGVPLEEGRPAHVTFIVGTAGKVVRVFEDVRPKQHPKELVEALDGLSK